MLTSAYKLQPIENNYHFWKISGTTGFRPTIVLLRANQKNHIFSCPQSSPQRPTADRGAGELWARDCAVSASVAKVGPHAFVVSRSGCVLLSSYCKKLGKFGDLLHKVSLEVTINVLSVRMNIFLSCSTVTDLFIVYDSLQYDHFRFDSQR